MLRDVDAGAARGWSSKRWMGAVVEVGRLTSTPMPAINALYATARPAGAHAAAAPRLPVRSRREPPRRRRGAAFRHLVARLRPGYRLRPPACAAVADDAARLACYDCALVAPPAAPGALPACCGHCVRFRACRAGSSGLDDTRPARAAGIWAAGGAEISAPRPLQTGTWIPATYTDCVNQQPNSPSPAHQVNTPLWPAQPGGQVLMISLKALLGDHLLGTPASLWAATRSPRAGGSTTGPSRALPRDQPRARAMLLWPMQADIGGWKLRHGCWRSTTSPTALAAAVAQLEPRHRAVALERGEWLLELRPWWRLREPVRRRQPRHPGLPGPRRGGAGPLLGRPRSRSRCATRCARRRVHAARANSNGVPDGRRPARLRAVLLRLRRSMVDYKPQPAPRGHRRDHRRLALRR